MSYSPLTDVALLVCALLVVGSAIAFWKDVREARKRKRPETRGFEVVQTKPAEAVDDNKCRRG